MSGLRHATTLETLAVDVPDTEVELWEQTLGQVCDTVGLFLDEATGWWRIEGVKPTGHREAELAGLIALAQAAAGRPVTLLRQPTEAQGWLARTQAAFPEQSVGRFTIRGTHLPPRRRPGRIVLRLDAGAAFGSGEHFSTRGCLRALELVAHRRPRRILDLGTGSGILAMAAVRVLHRRVLASDIDPWSVRVAAENAGLNGVGTMIRCVAANGWRHRVVRRAGPYDLVFANILARPLCAMAGALAAGLAPGGTAILSGLLTRQMRQVLAAHRRVGLSLERALPEQGWSTLVLRKR